MKKIYTVVVAVVMTILPGFVFADETDVTTKYLKNPSFESKFTSWTQTNMQTQTNKGFELTAGNIYVEKWVDRGSSVGSCEIYQTLSKLPAGQYRLQAAAHNIQQDNATKAQTGAYIYAGTTRQTVTVTSTYSLEFTTLGESFNVGFKANNATGNWLCIDNFRLYFIGEDAVQMLEALNNQITTAQKTLTTASRTTPPMMQKPYYEALTTAIEEAQKLDETSTTAQFEAASIALDKANQEGSANYSAMSSLKTLANKAVSYTRDTRLMAATYKQTLQAAYDSAQAVLAWESDADVAQTMATLQEAYDNAVASNTAYTALNKSITTAGNIDTEGKEGAEDLVEAIETATAVRNREDATPDEMNAAQEALDTAILLFRITNATGNELTVRTGVVVQGATEIFARATFGSGTAREKGLCWSTENPEPTIFENRTTDNYENNGTIFVIKEAKPATLYYVRAYAISSTYKLSYGDVVKTYTRPKGNATFTYDNAGDDATNERIRTACEEGVWYWNNITGIQNFHLDAHYVPGAGAGGGTADCSYGGYMRVSQNVPYQRTGTILHEGAHGHGMVPYTDWTNSIYRANGDRGDWLGPRVDRVIQFLENSATAKLHGDNQHMWPYGINGSGEDTGSPILYRANALLVGALAEDGIRTPNMNFLKPAYSFTQDDETKYYIKNSDESRGLKTSYLVEGKNGILRWEEMTSDEVFQNDSCAWNITFIPSSCYYNITNVATGRTISYVGTGANGIRTNVRASASSNLHLLAARAQTQVDNFTFSTLSYWLVCASSLNCLNATANGATASASFNHSDNSTTQRWLFLTADEVARFGETMGETVRVRDLEVTPQGTLRVLGGKGFASITAIGRGATVNVYGLDGRLHQQLYIQQDSEAVVRLPRGIYMIGNQKVMVR